jgi:hypothetical protein
LDGRPCAELAGRVPSGWPSARQSQWHACLALATPSAHRRIIPCSRGAWCSACASQAGPSQPCYSSGNPLRARLSVSRSAAARVAGKRPRPTRSHPSRCISLGSRRNSATRRCAGTATDSPRPPARPEGDSGATLGPRRDEQSRCPYHTARPFFALPLDSVDQTGTFPFVGLGDPTKSWVQKVLPVLIFWSVRGLATTEPEPKMPERASSASTRARRPTGERASSASTRARRPSNQAARAAATAGWRTSPASCEPRRRSRRSEEVAYGDSARRASKTTRGRC